MSSTALSLPFFVVSPAYGFPGYCPRQRKSCPVRSFPFSGRNSRLLGTRAVPHKHLHRLICFICFFDVVSWRMTDLLWSRCQPSILDFSQCLQLGKLDLYMKLRAVSSPPFAIEMDSLKLPPLNLPLPPSVQPKTFDPGPSPHDRIHRPSLARREPEARRSCSATTAQLRTHFFELRRHHPAEEDHFVDQWHLGHEQERAPGRLGQVGGRLDGGGGQAGGEEGRLPRPLRARAIRAPAAEGPPARARGAGHRVHHHGGGHPRRGAGGGAVWGGAGGGGRRGAGGARPGLA